MSVLVVTITGLPLLAGALVVTALRHARPSTVYRATLAATGLTASCALALLFHAGNGRAVTLAWLPGTGRGAPTSCCAQATPGCSPPSSC